jgi:hypothetical protein
MSIIQYSKLIYSVNKGLQCLQEMTLEKKLNLKVKYFIDFSEIFSFYFPFEHDDENTPFDLSTSDNLIWAERVALNEIFRGTDNLIVLPPHVEELLNKIRLLELEINSTNLRNSDIHLLRNKIRENNGIKKIIENKEIISKGALSYNLRRFIINFIEKNYLQLRALKSITKSINVTNLYEAISSNKLTFFDDVYPTFSGENDKLLFSNAIPWFTYLLERLPKKPNENNYRDSLACSYLKVMNEKKIETKDVYIFISRSNELLKIIDIMYSVVKEGQRFNVTRNLYTYLFKKYSFQEDKGRLILDPRLSEFLLTFSEINEMYEKVEYYSADVSNISHSLKVVKNYVKDICESITNAENILYYLTAYDDIEGHPELNPKHQGEIQNIDKVLYEILDVLKSAYDSDNKLQQAIANREDIARKNISNLKEKLQNEIKVYENKSWQGYKHAEVEVLIGTPTFLKGIIGEMPTILIFRQKVVIDIAKQIFLNRVNEDVYNYEKSIELIKISYNRYKSAEYFLLLAYIEATISRWESAIEIINSNYSNLRSEQKLEFYYLKAFLCRKYDLTIEGLEACEDGLKIENDPRLLREKAVLLWQLFDSKDTSRIKLCMEKFNINPDRESFRSCITDALNILQNDKKYRNVVYKELTSRCFNSLAYFMADSDEYMEIKQSEKVFKMIFTIIPEEKDFPPRFFDTRGYINLMIIKKNSKLSTDNKITLLTNAESDFRKALESKGIIGKERVIIEKHLFEATLKKSYLEIKEPFSLLAFLKLHV